MADTILVTGGAGLVGSECCRHLVDHGYDVISVDNYGRGSGDGGALTRVAGDARSGKLLFNVAVTGA